MKFSYDQEIVQREMKRYVHKNLPQMFIIVRKGKQP
jgi:hypothetical protein